MSVLDVDFRFAWIRDKVYSNLNLSDPDLFVDLFLDDYRNEARLKMYLDRVQESCDAAMAFWTVEVQDEVVFEIEIEPIYVNTEEETKGGKMDKTKPERVERKKKESDRKKGGRKEAKSSQGNIICRYFEGSGVLFRYIWSKLL